MTGNFTIDFARSKETEGNSSTFPFYQKVLKQNPPDYSQFNRYIGTPKLNQFCNGSVTARKSHIEPNRHITYTMPTHEQYDIIYPPEIRTQLSEAYQAQSFSHVRYTCRKTILNPLLE